MIEKTFKFIDFFKTLNGFEKSIVASEVEFIGQPEIEVISQFIEQNSPTTFDTETLFGRWTFIDYLDSMLAEIEKYQKELYDLGYVSALIASLCPGLQTEAGESYRRIFDFSIVLEQYRLATELEKAKVPCY